MRTSHGGSIVIARPDGKIGSPVPALFRIGSYDSKVREVR